MINSTEQLLRQFEALPGHAFGIQLDSGMNRLGMEPAEWAALRDIALSQNPTLTWEFGIIHAIVLRVPLNGATSCLTWM